MPIFFPPGIGVAAACASLFGQDFVKRSEGLVDVFFFDDVGRQETQNGFAGAVDEDVALHHFAKDGFRQVGGVKFDGEHEAKAADVGHDGVPFGELAKLFAKISADRGYMIHEVVALDGGR